VLCVPDRPSPSSFSYSDPRPPDQHGRVFLGQSGFHVRMLVPPNASLNLCNCPSWASLPPFHCRRQISDRKRIQSYELCLFLQSPSGIGLSGLPLAVLEQSELGLFPLLQNHRTTFEAVRRPSNHVRLPGEDEDLETPSWKVASAETICPGTEPCQARQRVCNFLDKELFPIEFHFVTHMSRNSNLTRPNCFGPA